MATNINAINDLVSEHDRLQEARYLPLVTLARTLAGQMDEAGGDPSTRLSAAYLSVLKDIERALREKDAEDAKPGDGLTRFRTITGGKTG